MAQVWQSSFPFYKAGDWSGKTLWFIYMLGKSRRRNWVCIINHHFCRNWKYAKRIVVHLCFMLLSFSSLYATSIVWYFVFFAGAASLFSISTPPGLRRTEGEEEDEEMRGKPSLPCRTVQSVQVDEEPSDLTEEGKVEKGREKKGAEGGRLHSSSALREQREKRWSAKWHGLHPNDEWWIAAQGGRGEEEERPCGRLPHWGMWRELHTH